MQLSKTSIIAASALIAGNLIGAGILGLPINTGLAGFLPSMLAMVAGGGLMWITAGILGNYAANNRSEAFDYPSLYEKFLGRVGKWVAIAANLVILYGLLTAYFTGGSKIVSSLIGWESRPILVLLPFAALLIVLTCIKLSLIQRLNVLLMTLLLASFLVLISVGIDEVRVERIRYSDWLFLPSTLPIIVTAFHFHNIIPTVSSDLNWDRARLRKAVLLGMLIAFFMNALWVTIGIGMLPLTGENSLMAAWENNIPATVPMSALLQSNLFTLFASFFSLAAITTSFMANGLGLQSFLHDLMSNTFGLKKRAPVVVAAFLPPLLISIIYPDIFLKALDVVGGVGIIVLFGILPLLVSLKQKRAPARRLLYAAALLFALLILTIEVLYQMGLLDLQPHVEYHKVDF